MELDPKTDLTFSRHLKVPRAVLWDCWTTPKHLMAFFVPKPHSVSDCEIVLRPGGRFDTTFKVDGTEMRNEGVFLEVVQDRRLVFTDAYTEGWKPAVEPFMTAIIEFEDHPEGGTLYTATARHRTPEARQSHEEMGFYDGWGIVADQLDEYAQALQANA